MINTIKFFSILAAFCLLLFPAAPATADWAPGDGYKMHFPQLPDPNGWDVAWSDNSSPWLGDDWTCSESGPVSDIHLWVSFKGWDDDDVPPNMAGIPISVQIWSNDPYGGGTYSTPKGTLPLWEKTFYTDPPIGENVGKYTIRHYGAGNQRWFEPGTGIATSGDHTQYFQINIDEIENPFSQVEGEVYWLVVRIQSLAGVNQPGWKTADMTNYPVPYAGESYMDNAVFYFDGWNEIFIGDVSRDLAFVITPEPGTLVLLVTAGMGAMLFVWRKRRAG